MTLGFTLVMIAGIFLAFSNGANDNFKGVATLFGSKTASYKMSLLWATLTTLAGSVAALFLAQKLIASFSGKGLVPEQIVQLTSFSASVALATAMTVFLATRLGFPISTTHALTGALVGTGILASPTGVNTAKLFSSFFLPLLISPFLAIAVTMLLYPLFSFIKRKMKIERTSCLCIGKEILSSAPLGTTPGTTAAFVQLEAFPSITVGTKVTCETRYVGEVWGLNAKTVLDTAHFLSSGLVSFARGLNDTPKIAAILLVGQSFNTLPAIGMVAAAMAIGGVIFAKKIAEKMAFEITEMNDGQGFSANFVTGLIVIGASHLGMPVSTTHVSCGSLFGIGAVTKKGNWRSIAKIFLAWIFTLPIAGLLGFLCFLLLQGVL